MSTRASRRVARFHGRGAGRRFELLTLAVDRPAIGTVLQLPAFADEMNKSRRQVALGAAALAAAGWQVVQVDLYGCGDSAGEFADASWDIWLDDLRQALDRHHSRSSPLWLWGTRAGALFVDPLLADVPDADVLLWQPVLTGSQHLSQFLRIKTAGGLIGGDPPVTRREIDRRLALGEPIEVGGYLLTPTLARSLGAAELTLASAAGRVVWAEVSTAAQPSLSFASRELLARIAGTNARATAIAGLPFWASQELVEIDDLVTWTAAELRISHQQESAPASADGSRNLVPLQ